MIKNRKFLHLIAANLQESLERFDVLHWKDIVHHDVKRHVVGKRDVTGSGHAQKERRLEFTTSGRLVKCRRLRFAV